MNGAATAKIINFPNQTETWPENLLPESVSDSSLSLLVSAVLKNADFAETVKSLVEGYAVESIVRSLEKRVVQSDPFDPIYLADLEPDSISNIDARQLWTGGANVNDLSAGFDLFEDEE
jgi:hypothetical protein